MKVIGCVVLTTLCAILSCSSAQAAKLYWTSRATGKIERANLDGSQIETVASGLSGNYGLAIDEVHGHVYWTTHTNGTIARANLNGTGQQTLLSGLTGGPLTIRLDVPNGLMYWKQNLEVHRAKLDGTNYVKLLTTVGDGQGLAIDPALNRMYLSGWPEGNLQRANLDGTGLIDLVTYPGVEGLELDTIHSHLYLVNYDQGTIGRTDLNGTGFQLLVSGQSRPEHVALDIAAGKMYWGNLATGQIRRANLDGTGIETIVSNVQGVDSLRLLLDNVPEPGTPILAGLAMVALAFQMRARLSRHTMRQIALGTVLFTLSLASSAAATLTAYEGFNYPAASNLQGAAGGVGFSGGWTNSLATINSGSLSFGSLATSGNLALNTAHFALSNYRTLASPLGAAGTTTYFSFLLQSPTPGPVPQNKSYGLGLLGSGGNLFIGKASVLPAPTQYVLENFEGAGQVASGVPAVAGVTDFLVVRADFTSGNDTFRLYVNPNVGGTEPIIANAMKSDFNFGTIGQVQINGDATFLFDELRIGTTYADVAGPAVPEPSTLFLTGLALVPYALKRRAFDRCTVR